MDCSTKLKIWILETTGHPKASQLEIEHKSSSLDQLLLEEVQQNFWEFSGAHKKPDI